MFNERRLKTRSDHRPPAPRQLALLCLALPCALACQPHRADAGLLEGKQPIRVAGIEHPERLTDGVAAYEGDDWTSDTAARFTAATGAADYDLGEVRTIGCALIQGDNNDAYLLSGSLDQLHWSPLFEARPQSGGGLRTRFGPIELQTRYLRLTASGGDGLYSVSELAVYERCPERGAPALRREHGHSPQDLARRDLERFACALLLLLLLHRLGAPRLNLLLAAIPTVALIALVRSLIPLAPLFDLETLLRGTIAALALAALLREACSPRWHKPDPRYLKGALSLLALGALGCYFHFGSLQFWDNGKQRHTLVHGFDMRHYFPLGKTSRAALRRPLRRQPRRLYRLDSRHDVGAGGQRRAARSLHGRDAPRARAGAADRSGARALYPRALGLLQGRMRYFLESMGRDGYLGTLRDHGGNATPVWLLGAFVLFSHAPASELTLTLAGLIDPFLLLFLIWAVFRSYGARVALYMVILFGATDFYQFGSNMFGSTLRQDWLVAVGLGACALRTRRYSSGGALLAYGA